MTGASVNAVNEPVASVVRNRRLENRLFSFSVLCSSRYAKNNTPGRDSEGRNAILSVLRISSLATFTPTDTPRVAWARVKRKTCRNNGRLTAFFNRSYIGSCTRFRVITRGVTAYCALVRVDRLEVRTGAWCRFDGACGDSPFGVDSLFPSSP